jgi:glutamyl-Q tRNA(Asp) synthetase
MKVPPANPDSTAGLYVGRFAPSPTGPLHIGSLITAVASYLEARSHRGRWLVRMEDVDGPRSIRTVANTILHQIEAHGLQWDGEVLWQSNRTTAYQDLLTHLCKTGQAYPCACTRKEIADSSLLAADGSHRYPGTCRNGLADGRHARAWRVKTEDCLLTWQDLIQGSQQENIWQDLGDFILLRADGQFAYQLAVVADDAYQGITHIVRGADLLGSAGRQIFLQRLLGYTQPVYAHLPIATNIRHEKLSKQTLAKPIDTRTPTQNIWHALKFLGQTPPFELQKDNLGTLLQWALAHWQLSAVPPLHQQIIEDDYVS